MRRIRLPDSFEARFIIGRALFLVPVFAVLLYVFWRMHSSWAVLLTIKYCAFLGIAIWMAVDKAPTERMHVEKYYEVYAKDGFWSRTDILPISAAVTLCGLLMSAIKLDLRWMTIAFGLGALMWFGLCLKWLIFDRWVGRQIARLSG